MKTEQELEEALSRPSRADVEAMAKLPGDLMILGVSGKMGPSLAALARRACEQAGVEKRIIGVARFSAQGSREALEQAGVETISCDLLEPRALQELPDCPNVIFMAGFKFGSSGKPAQTWAANVLGPVRVAERFAASRIVAFSSGNVYPFTAVETGGPRETDPVGPVGEYAQSVLGRERIFEYFSDRNETPAALLRLNYAIDLRYGVLFDVAHRVFHRRPIDLSMGHVNVIWQRDANSVALRCFEHCSVPPFVLNVTGTEIVSIRKLAESFGSRFGVEPHFEGREQPTALLSNAAHCAEIFGPPEVSLEQMMEWVASWVKQGGRSLGKPTHYEERAGVF